MKKIIISLVILLLFPAIGVSGDITRDKITSRDHVVINEISPPANAAVNSLRLYVDSADEHLKVKDSSGVVTDLNVPSGANVFNVMNPTYGALGNDVDDSTAVEAALAAMSAGDTLYFPCGTFVLDTELIPTVDNITFLGNGPCSIIKLHQTPVGTEAIAKGVLIWIDGIDGIKIKNIRFEGPATAVGFAAGLGIDGVEEGAAIHIQSANDTEVDQCEFIYNGTFKGGPVFVKGNGGDPSLRTQITNNYAEQADEFTYSYSMVSFTLIENNTHINGFGNAYRGTGNGGVVTHTGVSDLSFNDNGGGDDTIVTAGATFSGFRTSAPFDSIEITDSDNNNITVIPTAVTSTTITVPTGTLTAESNTSATIQANRNSTDNRIIGNKAINPGAMCIEDFETSVGERVINTQIIGNYCIDPSNIGISYVGHKGIVAYNTVINPLSSGIEVADSFGRVIGNHVEQTPSSAHADTTEGIIIDHKGAKDFNGTTQVIGNVVSRFHTGLKLQSEIGSVILTGNTIINSKSRGIDGASIAGETVSVILNSNLFYYDIGTHDHEGAEILRVAIGNPQTANFIAAYNEITYADTAGGGAQGNYAILLATELDNAQYIGNIVNDNGVQSQSTDVQISSIGGTPDRIVLRGNKFNTATVNLTGMTNTIWENNQHTGTKTGFSKTSLIEFTQTSGVGTPGTSVETVLLSDTVPANVLDSIGKIVKIKAWGTTAANADTKTMRLNFGATELYASGADASNDNDWYIEATITRTGAATQDWIVTGGSWNGSAIAPIFGTATETLSTDTTVEVTGENVSTTTANNTIAEGFSVEYLN